MATGFEVNPAGGVEANAFATGAKKYGANRGTTATSGPVSKIGYLARTRKQAARKKAIADIIAKKTN